MADTVNDTEIDKKTDKSEPKAAETKTANTAASAKTTAPAKKPAAKKQGAAGKKPAASAKKPAAKKTAAGAKTAAGSGKKSAAAGQKPAAKTAAKATKTASAGKSAAAKAGAAKRKARMDLKAKSEAIKRRKTVSDSEYGLKLFYQPIYYTTEKRIYGYECLLRVVDKDLGVITPDLFLPVAKKSAQLLNGLEEWTVDELFRASRMFREQKRFVELLSLNISNEQFFRKDFVPRVLANMDKLTENVCFELKEDVLFDKSDYTRDALKVLREAGIIIAVDDFSSSFLTFDWGDELPFDLIKIERVYIDNFLVSPKSRLIVGTIVDFAKERGLDVVAVGIENAEQEAALGELGITKMQGYYYSKPLQVKRVFSKK